MYMGYLRKDWLILSRISGASWHSLALWRAAMLRLYTNLWGSHIQPHGLPEANTSGSCHTQLHRWIEYVSDDPMEAMY